VSGRVGDDRPRAKRLFVAFRLPPATIAAVEAWQRNAVPARSGVRPMPPDHFHITTVFLGSRPEGDIPVIADVLRTRIAAAPRPAFRVHQYRETSRVAMLTLREDVVAPDAYIYRGQHVTGAIMLDLEARGMYRREHGEWRPHVTIARFRTPPRLTPSLPDLGSFRPTDVALFESIPQPDGSAYRVIDAFSLPPEPA
jgi:2'-5' RNA ligase